MTPNEKLAREIVRKKPEIIMHAAVLGNNGMIFLGKSHSCCMIQALGVSVKPLGFAKAQGFFTSRGRYVDRETAATIAFKAKQTTKRLEVLFSEDMWSPQSDGKYSYEAKKGYYE